MPDKENKGSFEKVLSLGYAKEVLIVSVIGAASIAFIAVLGILGVDWVPLAPLDWAMISAMVFVGPFGFYVSHKQKQIERIERRLPDFLRDVSEAGRFGMTLSEAIVVSARGRYGALTPEIKKMAAQIRWGVPANEALRLFSERVNTDLVNRVVAIITKANEAGGNVADVLNMVSQDAKEVHASEDEQKIAMTSYLAVIYIAFAVFIVVIIILNTQFLTQMEQAGAQLETEGEMEADMGGAGVAEIDVDQIPVIRYIFALAVFAHAVGDGIVAGILQTGKITNGMKHSFILLVIGFVSLRVLFGGMGLML
ncbi:MAG: type II secretion system F family protein [Candidatus Thermoplasmatota archaeon]|nr:type II secretion system F family protein [Candidatus Thermoplasmatota archaeon]MBS3789987.1 type II secretion system F family protein [Candidatus Thermoplasmatota archaeon]